ncbi:tetratricopeptide repeat protein [Candidatus Methylopumilus universalis]|nr:tetratricopeptide repeat protein [Candidatus Methylopumilus universalis]
MHVDKKLSTELDDVQNHFSQARLDLAFIKIDRIIKNNKKHYLPWNYRGILNLKIGEYKQALEDFKKSLSLNTNFALGFNNVALCYQALGDIKYAIEFYGRASSLDPTMLEAKVNLGSLYLDSNKFSEAITILNIALGINPLHEHTHQLIADAYIKIAKFDLSLSHHFKARDINPTNYFNYYLLGSDYLWSGHKEEASSNFLKAIELNPKYCQSYYGLSRVMKINPEEPILSDISKLLHDESINKSDRVYLNFSMAKVYEGIDSNLFFKYLDEENKLKKEINGFSFESFQALSDKSIDLFLNHVSKINQLPESANESIDMLTPIFIVGMPRSGTSLLEQVFSNDPRIFGAGEIDLFHSTLIKIMSSENPSSDITNQLMELRYNYLSNIRSMTDKKFFTDKLPLNFHWLGFIKKVFPNAKIIHIERNPVATCFSIYKTLFAHGSLDFSYSQDDIVSFYKLYRNLMSFWSSHLSNFIFHANYEKIVKNPKDEFSLIFDYLGLSFSEEILEVQMNKRSVLTASDLQVREAIYDGSSHSWVKYEDHIQKFIQAFIG